MVGMLQTPSALCQLPQQLLIIQFQGLSGKLTRGSQLLWSDHEVTDFIIVPEPEHIYTH